MYGTFKKICQIMVKTIPSYKIVSNINFYKYKILLHYTMFCKNGMLQTTNL